METVEQSILAYLAKAVAESGSEFQVIPQTKLLQAGLLDSMGLVGLIQFLEAQFDLRISDADLGPELFETPASIASYVARRLA
ncbi:MAG: phosphopantetheine-binding protein [Devosia sp.]